MLWSKVIPGVVLLGIVIFVHELGHFLAAKLRGVRVLRFSLGFGPALASFTRGDTEYRLSWIPLGGYVQMAGDSPDEAGRMPDRPDEFLSHAWYGRIIIAAAGPFANLVTAYLVFVAVGLVGVRYQDYPNQLGPVPDSSVAAHAGLREGDRIVQVGGKAVASWVPVFQASADTPRDRALPIVLARGDSNFTLTLSSPEREPLLSSIHPPTTAAVIGNVSTGMPAYKAGIKEGDRILSVDGQPVTTWEQLPRAFHGKVDRDVPVQLLRGTQRFTLVVRPIDRFGKRGGQDGLIGIEPPAGATFVQRYSLIESVTGAWGATWNAVANVYGGMWLTISRPLYYREYLGGPIFIAQAASEQARRGLDAYLQFLAMINIAIMAFNLLPIPVLDGGHILWALIEAVSGRGKTSKAYLRYQKVGLVVVGTLLLLILANDPLRLVQRQRALDRAPQEGHVAPGPP